MRPRHLLLAPPLAISLLWGSAALWVDGPEARSLAGLAVAVFALGGLASLLAVRPFARGLGIYALLFLSVLGGWLTLSPSNERSWEPGVARLARGTLSGDTLTIQNLRNFRYRSETDYDERWQERRYDLSQLRGADLFLSYWGSPWIAHTIMSWDFGDGGHLAISIETRKERDESYSALLGFFRQFELYYVVADERDLVGVRTHHRGEDVYLYRLAAAPETARRVLLDYLEEINALAERPRWYHALTHNCTTMIRHHVQNVAPGNPFDWRILVNGRLDELGYLRGTIDTSMPFAELRRTSAISERAKARAIDAGFSERIRAGLPTPDRRSH